MTVTRCLARTTTAAIALALGGFLVLSNAHAQSSSDEGGGDALDQTSPDFFVIEPASDVEDSESESESASDAENGKSDSESASDAENGKSESESASNAENGKSKIKPAADVQAEEDADIADVADAGEGKDNLFGSDPQYEEGYAAQEQADVYGAKEEVVAPRPALEIGREQYTSGEYDESSTLLGEKNPLLPGLAVYGDWRTAVAFNKNNGQEIAQVATRLNLDVDFKITGTERIHAFFTPLQKDAQFSRFEFGGADGSGDFDFEFDPEPQTLFFEGDLGSIYTGFSGNEASFDLPFTVGLFPLFLQNGIWANDAILGGAVSFPAKNSAALGLPNFDITLFAAFDDVDNAGLFGAANNENNLIGATAFIDAYGGYIETGYGLVDGAGDQEGNLTHFFTAAYTRRYYNAVSNSTRVFVNVGEGAAGENDGLAIISENSLITGLPSTLLPYANFFVGVGAPQPLVDGNNAGILKNVGINFETDALTGFPKLDDTASDAWGGAIGLQYLFNLDQQLVFEVAMVQPFDDDGIGAQDAQYGFGTRYQLPLNRSWLFRADATYQILENSEDNFGLRAELRKKF